MKHLFRSRLDLRSLLPLWALLILALPGRAAEWELFSRPTEEQLNDIWLAPDGSFGVAAGTGGALLTYDGQKWSVMDSGTTNNLFAVWGTPSGEFVAGGENAMVIFDGESLSPVQVFGFVARLWMPPSGEVVFVHFAGNQNFPNGFLNRYDRATEAFRFVPPSEFLPLAFCGASNDVAIVAGDIPRSASTLLSRASTIPLNTASM